MNTIGFEIILIFVLILVNGLFAMSEIALVSARRTRLQQKAEEGEPRAAVAIQLAENPNRFLSTVQIGITLIGILAGAVSGATLTNELSQLLMRIPFLAPYASWLSFAIIVLLLTYFSLVIGELIPKRIAMNNPEAVAIRMAGLMRGLSRLTAPLVTLLSASTNLGIRLLGIRPSVESGVTEDEIRVMVEQGMQVGAIAAVEQNMIESVFRMGDRRVDALMTPRTAIIWLDLDESIQINLERVLSSEHSQFPVGQGSLDNIQGIIRAKDLLRTIVSNGIVPNDLRLMVFPPLMVPESSPAFRLLEQLRAGGQSMALVIDEYGGVMGMVTLFDILEAIVGEISGQGEESTSEIVQREDGSWLVDGQIAIDELKDILELDLLPGEERVGFQTLGGFMMSQIGAVPISGQYFDLEGLRFEVMDMDGHRVDKVMITRLKAAV